MGASSTRCCPEQDYNYDGSPLMADPNRSVVENIPGEFFVDDTCIDCDTCRQLAPQVFGETATHAFVRSQPQQEDERRRALWSLVCCPTGSIGTRTRSRPSRIFGEFPLLIEQPVYYCGFTSRKSFGGSSYFLLRETGNWLIDSPKFLPHLVARFEQLGGISNIFLTHQDDVADAHLYARHFGSRRYIHQRELAAQPDAEVILRGDQPLEIDDRLLSVPTPGHTPGHCALLYADRFLFSGDHLAWDREQRALTAYRDYCWHSWSEQCRSLARLLDYRFEWVLPGHGQRVWLPAAQMHDELTALVDRCSGD